MPSYEEALIEAATQGKVPTCHPRYEDTEDSLAHMGDLVECMYGIARGSDFYSLRSTAPSDAWRALHDDSCQCFHSINYLQCMLHGGLLKRSNEIMHPDPCLLQQDLPNTTAYLAAVIVLLISSADDRRKR